jgi:hypothetical protein
MTREHLIGNTPRLGFVRGASRSFKEGFGRMGLLARSSSVSCTLNTRGLEPKKLKDKESKIVADWQRNTTVKAKKDWA